MAVGRVSAAPPSILLTCLCFLFLPLRNQDICTAKPHDYIDCSVFIVFLRENPQRNGHVFFQPSCCVHHFRNFASVTERLKKKVFAQSRIPYYSNHSAVFILNLFAPMEMFILTRVRAAQVIAVMTATWLTEIDIANLIYLSSMLIQEA